MSDLRRFVFDTWQRGDVDLSERCLRFVDEGLAYGDAALENAIAVSFVADTGWWDAAMRPFIDTWPTNLRDEVSRQENWRRGEPAK